jgi:hypothetical protein
MARIIPLVKRVQAGVPKSERRYIPTGQIALVDDVDYSAVMMHRWGISKNYAYTFIDGAMLSLHRFIFQRINGAIATQTVDGKRLVVDHINRVPLDCRRSNLRLVTHAENIRNQARRRPITVGRLPNGRPRIKMMCVGDCSRIDARNLTWSLYLLDPS